MEQTRRESVEVYQMGQQTAGSKDVEGGAVVVVVPLLPTFLIFITTSLMRYLMSFHDLHTSKPVTSTLCLVHPLRSHQRQPQRANPC
jgi:hypothetical protein